ncbi:hypothetical protein GGI25_003570 [Coemansia spiralis]|uniref:Coiled-coil domain-containing protein 12 n=2 Tax=Coemansia TaxID=4863 RepID=A0A9W8KXY9_9FUNG|nr:hypothetical protein EDC05_003604 [Coemansia umbellata]KAJ2621297.1 hypothetical protein GGI26_004271 [Coemansia sp. RSA 1358]KAJ2676420.1 hypothetical protein GGI25_003570 [Coemansia spiralis]
MSGGLEEETRKRKARLQVLREARQKLTQPNDNIENDNNGLTVDSGDFKSTEENQEQTTEQAERGDTVEKSVDGVIEAVLAERQEAIASSDLDIVAIAPRRANWDLKHDLQQRLEKLKPQNDAAVADSIRERIQESGDADDLAGAVEAKARTTKEAE